MAKFWSDRLAEHADLVAASDENLPWLCLVESSGGCPLLRADRVSLSNLVGLHGEAFAALLERLTMLGHPPGCGLLLLDISWGSVTAEDSRTNAISVITEAAITQNLRIIPVAKDDDGLAIIFRVLKALREEPAIARELHGRDDRDVDELRAMTGLPRTRVAALMHEFGTIRRLAAASDEEIRRVPNVGLKTARVVIQALRDAGWRRGNATGQHT